MPITVRQLIAMLKKEDPDAVVVWQDHDHNFDEYNNHVRCVDEGRPELCEILGEKSVVTIRP